MFDLKKWRRAYLVWKRLRKRKHSQARYALWLEFENEKVFALEEEQRKKFLHKLKLEQEQAEEQRKLLLHLLDIQPQPNFRNEGINNPAPVIFSPTKLLKPKGPSPSFRPRPQPRPW